MTKTKKLSEIAFVTKAIEAVAARNAARPAAYWASHKRPQYPAVHTTFDGFNAAWTAYYGTDPVAGTKALQAAGLITIIPAPRGARISLAGVVPRGTTSSGDGGLLASMGLA